MPLNMTKIAFQSEGPASLRAWLESHANEARITTRYLPKRVEEMARMYPAWHAEKERRRSDM